VFNGAAPERSDATDFRLQRRTLEIPYINGAATLKRRLQTWHTDCAALFANDVEPRQAVTDFNDDCSIGALDRRSRQEATNKSGRAAF
jgi:hypothetical protein